MFAGFAYPERMNDLNAHYRDLLALNDFWRVDRVDLDLTGRQDDLAEGLYFRTKNETRLTGRAKFVRPEFVDKIKQSTH